jgi:hypothetical protein
MADELDGASVKAASRARVEDVRMVDRPCGGRSPLCSGGHALTRVNEFVNALIAKDKGIVISTTLTVVSNNGNTRTSTTVVVTAEGRTVANIAVYDRQR